MIKKPTLAMTLVILFSIILILLLIRFDNSIIHFLSQFNTTKTLLQYSDFWNQRIHDWLGDAITIVGVMLAFTLPFTAQVVQWVVSTYVVNSFPEMVKDKLQINQLLKEMFIFVGVVIFWRVFIYDISPYSTSLYILFNLIISVCFVRILVKLFHVVNFILKCTFDFQQSVMSKAYNHLELIAKPMPTSYLEKTDVSTIPALNRYYSQNLELIRDYEISKFKKGDIDISEKTTFDINVWRYIRGLLSTNDLTYLKDAALLQKNYPLQLSKCVRCLAMYIINFM